MSKVGVCEWCMPVWGPSAVEFAANCGFEGVQVTDLRGAFRGFPMTNKRIQEGYLEASERTGVALASMHLMAMSHSTGHCSPWDSPKNQLAQLSLKRGIESCTALGIRVINISGGDAAARGPVLNRELWDNLILFLNHAVKVCGEKGIVVAYETSMEINRLRELLERVPGLQLSYDIRNCSLLGVGFQIPENVPERIDHVHVCDDIPDENTGILRPVISGTGTVGKLEEGIRILKEKGYDGWYYSESKYGNFTLPEDFEVGSYGARFFKELDIDCIIPPQSFGGTDLTEVCRRDCEAIKKLVNG